ncbi:UDP-2,4-diacetamido-2,4,6-trideoxy-beta-L-altropyranose hydrolase [bacterium]|nr:UDP-2,4-diacetamido-2,4,6-trideoxy-beta-L-altropyranose hydrolase [bacterium]
MKVIIRADASTEIGAGHVMRCLALSQALRRSSHTVHFVTKTEDSSFLSRIHSEVTSVTLLDSGLDPVRDAQQSLEEVEKHSASWFVTDGYHFDTEYQRLIKSSGVRLLSIDDINEFHFLSDIILNQNWNAEVACVYSHEPDAHLLLGSVYALLRSEYQNLDHYERRITREASRVFVTLGGSDPKNCTYKVLTALHALQNSSLQVRVLLGAAFSHHDSIQKLQESFSGSLEILPWVDSLRPLIEWCDVAISSAGSTCWELAAMQTPMIIGGFAENQRIIVEELHEKGAAESLGWFESVSEDTIANTVHDLLSNHERRHRLSKLCANICDGQGAQRVVAEMEGIGATTS